MSARSPTARIGIAVMAAGASRRFGSNKQLAEIGGEPMLGKACSTAVEVCGEHTAVVLGHDWARVSDGVATLPGFMLINERWEQGLGTSIAQAARSLRHAVDGLIIMLADQPLITAAHLRALIAAWSGDPVDIVATQFAGTLGPPTLFASGCFDALAELDGDAGARVLLDDPGFTVRRVAFDDAAIDIDTPADLGKLQR